jgi:hypothetical protein
MKKLIFTLIFITTLTFAQQVKAQEIKEYVTVSINTSNAGPKYSIAYPDGTTEDGEIDTQMFSKNLKSNGITINGIFNKLAKKGYRLVSNGGGDMVSYFVFEK